MLNAARKADDTTQTVEAAALYVALERSRAARASEPAHLVLQIAAVLQTTLDCEKLIGLFSRELSTVIPHDGVAYVNDEHGIAIRHGKPGRHCCTYRLIVENRVLGDIRFMRQRRFEDAETGLFEYLLCGLVYALRNALDYRQVMENARRDPLTGVYNRSSIEGLLRREIGLARRHGTPLSVAFLDIDHFKSINDTHGHAVGDRAIRLFVECVAENIRDTDVLGRYGGDEFVLILSNTPLAGAGRVAERIRRAVEQRECPLAGGGRLRLTASIGLATLSPQDGLEQLCEKADCALNLAKRNGRNRVAF